MFKTTIIGASICFIAVISYAQTSTISEVTIFRTGAQIKREATINLKAGKNEIVIGGLPKGFDESSIQVNTAAKTFISDVSYKNNFVNEIETNPAFKSLNDQYKAAIIKQENETVTFDTWKEEEAYVFKDTIFKTHAHA